MNEASRKISLDYVIKQSFKYWSSTLFYQLIFTLIYFSTLLILGKFLLDYYEIYPKIQEIAPLMSSNPDEFSTAIQEITFSDNFKYFSMMVIVATAIIYPLNIGFFKIYTLIDAHKKVNINDLFAGFSGSNFFKFFGYYLLWGGIYFYLKPLVIPGFLWIMFTIFVAPLLYFTPMNLTEALKISFKVVGGNFFIIAACSVLAIIFSYAGIFLCFFGLFFTFPFWNAIIYTLFKSYFRIKFV